MAGMTLAIPEEFKKQVDDAAATKAVAAVEGVTEDVKEEATEGNADTVEEAVNMQEENNAVKAENAKAPLTKEEKFEALAQKRVERILEEIDKLGALANRRNYAYNEDLVQQIFEKIRQELEKQQKLFAGIKIPRFQFRK